MHKKTKDFSIIHSICIVALFILLNITIDIIVRIILTQSTIDISNPFIRIFINITSFIIIINYVCRKDNFEIKNIFKKINCNIFMILSMLFITIGMRIIFTELSNYIEVAFPLDSESYVYNKNVFGGNISLLGSIVATVFFAPISEEIFFRGVILRGLLRTYNKKTAVFVSAILFALFHLNIYVFIPAVIVGLFIGWTMIKFNSIIPCILIHSLYNGFPRILKYIFNIKIQGFNIDSQMVEFQPLWFNILGVSCLIVGWLFILFSNYNGTSNIHKLNDKFEF
ncbi:CPBP family intramembrane glutamic endopeptidase [Oceanirhabdus sp. W0125-5]|uniref:CPBP family intramembrane glutamic endopeptidase n=1 Tax=Oceanirhabdus sp. W0125-5 TaxID=2999116 RepID=UPI0022F341B7|nr:CPBP family intramembrane glutamic endopeptidase [Oceanirhabdus sp. W0125-5]WBW97671.1 CPBP family intramembrane metalloprotease [Oceanirhabdus sp. W0125-5]